MEAIVQMILLCANIFRDIGSGGGKVMTEEERKRLESVRDLQFALYKLEECDKEIKKPNTNKDKTDKLKKEITNYTNKVEKNEYLQTMIKFCNKERGRLAELEESYKALNDKIKNRKFASYLPFTDKRKEVKKQKEERRMNMNKINEINRVTYFISRVKNVAPSIETQEVLNTNITLLGNKTDISVFKNSEENRKRERKLNNSIAEKSR